MSGWITGLIIFGVIVLGIFIPCLCYTLIDRHKDKRSEKFQKLYPNIYKLVDDYTNQYETLDKQHRELNNKYKQNCAKISSIKELLPNISENCDKYKNENSNLKSLKEENAILLTQMDDIDTKRKELYSLNVELAQIFYTYYVTKIPCDDIELR